MKRYLLFAGLDYYPRGGWGDFITSADIIEELINKATETNDRFDFDWYQIVDTLRMETTEYCYPKNTVVGKWTDTAEGKRIYHQI